MPSYWWSCESCGQEVPFNQATRSRGIAHYIWDVLLPSGWDQSALIRTCANCGVDGLRITYEFPRAQREILRISHLVGLPDAYGDYLPMMWETTPLSSPAERWVDFKYVRGRSIWGLNKPAVLSRADLGRLLAQYRAVAGVVELQ